MRTGAWRASLTSGSGRAQADQSFAALHVSTRKSLSGLPPKLPGADHAPQQGSRTVLVVAEIAVQRLQNVEADIETDQVGQRQRTHRVRHAELHHLVDRFAEATPSWRAKIASLIIGSRIRLATKPGRVVDDNRRLSDRFRRTSSMWLASVRCLEAAHDLDQRKHRHRVEKMESEEAIGSSRRTTERRDRDRRGVRGENCLAARDPREFLKERGFRLEASQLIASMTRSAFAASAIVPELRLALETQRRPSAEHRPVSAWRCQRERSPARPRSRLAISASVKSSGCPPVR